MVIGSEHRKIPDSNPPEKINLHVKIFYVYGIQTLEEAFIRHMLPFYHYVG